MSFVSGPSAVTQDVIHPGLRATSYSVAVAVQNLFGSFTAPIVIGKMSDLTNLKTAMAILPTVLLVGSILFYIGSKFYMRDLEKVAVIKMEAA